MAYRMQPSLIWVGAYNSPTGYGDEARGFIGALERGGFNLRIGQLSYSGDVFLTAEQQKHFMALERVPVDPLHAPVVHHYPPYQLRWDIWGQVNISRTMFETDRIPAVWIEHLHRVNEVWVPCIFNLETFAYAGVPRNKLRVVHGGVDSNIFHPAAPPLDLGEKKGFTFLSFFIWTDHKGWDLLLTAYFTEFKPEEDVMLLIKTAKMQNTPGTIEEQYRAFRDRFAARQKALPEVRILNGIISDYRLPGLYTYCDAFVLPSRNEAWGRPYMEAMACGLPVIGTGWGGNLEFMNNENSYLIEIEGLEDVPDNAENAIYKGHKWSKPSVDHLRQLMRYVYEHRQEARARGAKARADVSQHWTWDHAACAIANELAKFNVQTAPAIIADRRKNLPEQYMAASSVGWESTALRGTRRVPPLGSLR
ncbi:MAG: glycosyltransferase [Thermacetogeniaceae bacterium]